MMQDYFLEQHGIEIGMSHDPQAWLKPAYEIRLPSGKRLQMTIEELRIVRTLLNENMVAIERHATNYSHP